MSRQKFVLNHEGKPYRRFFEEISMIPRNSFDEKRICEYLVEYAEKKGFWHYSDEIGNVLIKKPGSPGYERKEPVLIQAHTDMVCVKTPDSKHDFTKDPLDLYVDEQGWLRARGTSLGADNGAGVAHMLALLDDPDLKHPPLEAFFSVQEEQGLGGARNMDYSHFQSKRVISTDILFEGVNYRTTADAIGGDFIKKVSFESCRKKALSLKVHQCFGGHAALNISKDPANAIKCAARLLFYINESCPITLAAITGGSARNNVPTDCTAVFTYEEADFSKIETTVRDLTAVIKKDFSFTDPDLAVDLSQAPSPARCLTKADSESVLTFLYILPTGVYYRNHKYGRTQSFVETSAGPLSHDVFASTNTGLASIENDRLIIGKMFRGGAGAIVLDLKKQVEVMSAAYGAHYEEEYRYPGFTVPDDSRLTAMYEQIYYESAGKKVVDVNLHGGNEGGTMVNSLGGPEAVDIVSIGVDSTDLHTFDEAMNLDSFDRVYRYLVTLLERL